jgi:hypothetical protein
MAAVRQMPDRISQGVWLLLAVLGAVMAVVGWYRYFGA